MEQSEVYKSVETKIKSLEQQLAACDDTIKQCEQSGREAEKDIEEHFARCINALAERKAVLLKEVTQKATALKKMIEDRRVKLLASIKASKQTLEAGATIFTVSPSTAEVLLKGLLDIPALEVTSVGVTTRLSMTLFNDIQKHGEVEISSRFSRAQMVTTLAGSGAVGQKDGKGTDASFYHPWGMCMNSYDQCLYICDYSSWSIRKLTLQGEVTTFVERSQVKKPTGIAMNHKLNCFYVANNGHAITKITSSGTASPFAGSGQPGSSDGVGASASFHHPYEIAIDQQTGNLFVSDHNNHSIRKITPQGEVSTLAGSRSGFADGTGKAAKFFYPQGICFDENSQSLLVCDYCNNKLRCVQLTGEVSTLCDIQQPASVAVTLNQTILVSTQANKLFRIIHQGPQKYSVELLAGSGTAGKVDGRPDECSFDTPRGIVVDEASHSCAVVDNSSHAIRKVSFANPN